MKEQKENELLDIEIESNRENRDNEVDVLEIKEDDKDIVEEIKEEIKEEIVEDENLVEDIKESDVDKIIKNNNKHKASSILVNEAKKLVKEADTEMKDCKVLLDTDLKEYENAKKSLKDNAILASEEALKKLGITNDDEEEDNKDDAVAFEAEKQPNINIKDTSSGKFGAFILSLIAGGATLAGMVYFASVKSGTTLDPSNLGSSIERQPIASFYSRLIGLNGDALYGTLFVVAISLLVMYIVYRIKVGGKATKNLSFATDQFNAANEYKDIKKSFKDEMDKVDVYVTDAVGTLKTYEIMLNEQKSKLERILHVEQEKIESFDFHEKSHEVIEDTKELIAAAKKLISNPLSEDGKLSEKSHDLLNDAKYSIKKMIDKLY